MTTLLMTIAQARALDSMAKALDLTIRDDTVQLTISNKEKALIHSQTYGEAYSFLAGYNEGAAK